MDLRMVGLRIREIRTNKNLTQEELAELADISVTHISALERGVKNANLSTFVAIANMEWIIIFQHMQSLRKILL